MEKKNKGSVSTIMLIVALIVIIVMGIFLVKLSSEKANEARINSDLQTKVESLTVELDEYKSKIASISSTISGSSSTALKPSSTISRLVKNREEAEKLITDNEKIDDFYHNEFVMYVGDSIWKGLVGEYTASSTKTGGSEPYNAISLNNLYIDNAWCEGVEGDGVGETIEINAFASSSKVNQYVQTTFNKAVEEITDVVEYISQNNIEGNHSNELNQIAIINGNAKSDQLWKDNGRVKKLKLTIDNKVEYMLELEDSKDVQIFDINYKNDTISKAINLKFEIVEVYPGEKDNNTCLTSIFLSGGTDINWGGI